MITYKSKLAYHDKLHDQPWAARVIDVYRDDCGTYIEFEAACVRVPHGWQPTCKQGDSVVAYYAMTGEFVFDAE